MQNLKEVKRRAEEQIRGFQQELEIINRAIEITKKYGANGIKDDVADLRKMADSKSFLEPEEIEMAILAIKGDFKAEDVISEVKKRFAERPNCSTNAIATALHRLIKAGKLRYVRERAGRRPAIYKGAL